MPRETNLPSRTGYSMPKSTSIWWEPKGLSAGQAAAHLGISQSKFDELVKMAGCHSLTASMVADCGTAAKSRSVSRCCRAQARLKSNHGGRWGSDGVQHQ